MSTSSKLSITQLCINGHIPTLNRLGAVNSIEIHTEQGCDEAILTLCRDEVLNIKVGKVVSEFNYTLWAPGSDDDMILNMGILLPSIPIWFTPYSKLPSGTMHRIDITAKVARSETNYMDFTRRVRSNLLSTQFRGLEISEGVSLWEKRMVGSASQIVMSVKFKQPHFSKFSQVDLDRLKNDNQWLSDSHVTLGLLDCYQYCIRKKIWGELRVKLFDTTFWEKLSSEPGRYRDKFMEKNNLLECDFAVVPMFASNHWGLGIVEKPGEFMEGKTIFHLLDSLPSTPNASREARQLQNILLKHFKGVAFKENRVSSNCPMVPIQPNSKDCGCFTVFFAKKFFKDPLATLAVIKTSFSSQHEALAAWGLETSDLTFVRREIRGLLLDYISRGDAMVEFG